MREAGRLKRITTEAQLEKYGKKELRSIGCLVYKFVSPAKRGVPDDIVVCPDGQIIFIEYKAPNGSGKLSKIQRVEIQKLRDNKARVLIIEHVEQVNNLVHAIKRGLF